MNELIKTIKKEQTSQKTKTENGMKAKISTNNYCVDLFFKIGASRGLNILPDFINAYNENPDYALRIALWARDIRCGAGERTLIINIINHLIKVNYKDAIKLISKLPELGRFKDLVEIELENNSVKIFIFNIIKFELENKNGLVAKWLPRKSKDLKIKYFINEFRKYLKLTPKEYRLLLSSLSNTVEQKMSSKKWNDIKYSHVPSLAMARYSKIFMKKDQEGFNNYKTNLVNKIEKVNSNAIYPYDVTKSLYLSVDEIISEEQWKSLENYLDDRQILPMVDVSESMLNNKVGKNLNSMDIAISLGLYIADKSKGVFKNTLLTFTDEPRIYLLNEKETLLNKLNQIRSHIGYNTNIADAFKALLYYAKKGNVSKKDMPEMLLLLSDMQFDDHCIEGKNLNAFKLIKELYKKSNYEMPKLVFWNIAAKSNVPVKYNKEGVALISGFSPSIMKSVLKTKDFSPLKIMEETILINRYDI